MLSLELPLPQQEVTRTVSIQHHHQQKLAQNHHMLHHSYVDIIILTFSITRNNIHLNFYHYLFITGGAYIYIYIINNQNTLTCVTVITYLKVIAELQIDGVSVSGLTLTGRTVSS